MNKSLLKMYRLLPVLLLCSSMVAFAQRTVTGKVTSSEDNTTMPGVSVAEKGTSNGAVTDADGNYRISINEGATLVFSFVGYKTQEVAVGAQTKVDILLTPEITELSEIVVVAYGTEERRDVTGSIASVKGTEVMKSPALNVSNSLAGRLPGLIALGQSGEPGADFSTLLIRGLSTIGNNSPLIVVDGVPNRSLERIDPSTIENISVIKDASAAIYGSQAANGLILITTKRGAADKVSVSASFSQGFTRPTRVPEFTNSYEFAILSNELDRYRGNSPTYSPAALQAFQDGSDPWRYPDTDWFKEVLKPWSSQQIANVSVSGGTEALRAFVSFSTRYQDGFYNNSASDYKQHDLRMNLDSKISKYVSASLDMMGRLEDRNFPVRGSAKIFNELTSSRPDLHAYWPNGLPGPYLDPVEQSNPAVTSTSAGGYSQSSNYVINLNGKITVKIPGVEGLSVTGTAGLDRSFMFGKTLQTPWTLYRWIGGTVDANNIPVLTEGKYGPGDIRLNQNSDQFKGYLLNGMLNYERTFADNHTVKFLAGAERFQNQSTYFSGARTGLIAAFPDQLNFGDASTASSSGSTPGIDRWQHYFGRVKYDFKDKYLLEFVWRYQGSSKFSESMRTSFFPGISAAYRISDEAFWSDNLSFINSFKIRGSWGTTGNDLILPYQFFANYSVGDLGFMSFDPEDPSTLLNYNVIHAGAPPYIKSQWEESDQKNIGIDLTILQDRLSITADYFDYHRTKILIPETASVPSTPGFNTLPDVNKGEARNKGFDFNVMYNNSIGDLKFQIGANGVFSKNEVLDFDEPADIPDYQRTTGRPLFSGNYYRQIFYRAIGIFRDEEALDDYPHMAGAVPGDIIFEDYNKDGQISALDKVAIDKNHVPTFSGGLNLAVQYGGFDLSILAQATRGGVRYLLGRGGKEGNFLKSFYDQRWTVDNREGDFPRTFNRNDEYWMSSENLNTFWLRKTDYLRLKNVELGYSIPANLAEKLHVEQVRIFVSGLNLLIYSPDYEDYDPELEPKGDGFAGQGYPLQKIISTGINVQF